MIQTRSQRSAQRAFHAVATRFSIDAPANQRTPDKKKYLAFARSFATLIHTCGLAQATAFALAKKKEQAMVLDDLAAILGRGNGDALHRLSRGETAGPGQANASGLLDYLQLTRDALAGATWLKRYAEALLDDGDGDNLAANNAAAAPETQA